MWAIYRKFLYAHTSEILSAKEKVISVMCNRKQKSVIFRFFFELIMLSCSCEYKREELYSFFFFLNFVRFAKIAKLVYNEHWTRATWISLINKVCRLPISLFFYLFSDTYKDRNILNDGDTTTLCVFWGLKILSLPLNCLLSWIWGYDRKLTYTRYTYNI